MTATAGGYNGWANYETWNVALWIGNDVSAYNAARDYARAVPDMSADTAARFCFELFPDGTADMDSPADMCKVDWAEIRTMLLELVED